MCIIPNPTIGSILSKSSFLHDDHKILFYILEDEDETSATCVRDIPPLASPWESMCIISKPSLSAQTTFPRKGRDPHMNQRPHCILICQALVLKPK